jgi:peptide/nickel transport system ATP-binding protein
MGLRGASSLSNMNPLLSVENLSIEYQGKALVNEVSFTVWPGKCTAIVGESGSGKTLSCMTIMQLNPPQFHYPSGKLIFHEGMGVSTSSFFPKDEAIARFRGNKIGMIFQEPMSALNPTMRVGDQVAEAIIFHDSISPMEAKDRVLSLFNEVKIPFPEKAFDKFPHEMSGGQRQRVMIAMALSCEPSIIIADEPTTALDVSVQKAVLELLKEILQNRNIGLVFISHDLAVVKSIAQSICVMRKGQIVEQGEVGQVLHFPQHPYTQGLLACRPDGKKKGERLVTLEESPSDYRSKKTLLASEEVVLKANGLVKNYASFQAVREVSFEIKRGETLGLIGESGCGKTTLSRMLMGLLPISNGEVYWKNELLTDRNHLFPKKKRRQIQMVFQDPFSSLNPKLTIGSLLMEPMEIHQIGKNHQDRWHRAVQWLERVGLPEPTEAMKKFPHSFSGGQRQRIVIARALASEPELLICDESVAALDVSVQAQVLNLLNDLKEELQLTYLFISHDLHVVRYMSDRVMVMQKGEIVEIGPSDEVFENPQNEYTKTLVAAAI